MNNWESHYANGKEMAETAHAMIYEELGKIQFVNMKYTLYNEQESHWLYQVDFKVCGDELCITGADLPPEGLCLPLDRLATLRLRPYYFAICVGFKNFLFHNSAVKGGTQ